MILAPRNARASKRVVLPPFYSSWQDLDGGQILEPALYNPHPTDVLLDTSLSSIDRLPLVREVLLNFSGMLLAPVLSELEDLKTKPKLTPLRDLVFPDGKAFGTRRVAQW